MQLALQLGDSRLASVAQRRWRESLDAQEKADAGGNTWSDAGSLAPVESFAQGPESDIGAFAKGLSRVGGWCNSVLCMFFICFVLASLVCPCPCLGFVSQEAFLPVSFVSRLTD